MATVPPGRMRSARPRARTPGIPAAPGTGLVGRRVGDLAKSPPLTCSSSTTIRAAAALMHGRGAGSIVVVGDDGALSGIMTDRDLRKVAAHGIDPAAAVSTVMSSPVISVPADLSAFEALLEMTHRSIHHLSVVDGGRLVAVISSHDLTLAEGAHPLALAREIEREASLDGLARAATGVMGVVRWLVAGGAAASEVGRLVSELNDRLVSRATHLVEEALEADGRGRPPLGYAWLAAGSEARREQTLRTDQDNGLVYAEPPPEAVAVAADYFGRFATQMTAALVRIGFPACPGGFMASNPEWCGPRSAWQRRFASWMDAPEPQSLLNASVFFDLRPVAGDTRLGLTLWQWVCERAPSHVLFLRHLAREAAVRPSGLGWFGRLRTARAGPHRGRLDVKSQGIFPLTQGIRVCALSRGIEETNTLDRLREAAARGVVGSREADDLLGAWETVARLRLVHQLRCLDAGVDPDDHLDPATLGRADRLLLKDALVSVGWLQRFVQDRFLTDAVA